ncbi:hypothetical protein ABS767_03165 [Sphingomonas sp. ST-64]|uniref:Uncharacterized protein n=1 Tax=Sphingomonas plantiphila TaxID=3163295 RepID=A0ABW8YI62_9SPHN
MATNLLILVHESATIPSQLLLPYIILNLIGFALLGGAIFARSRWAIFAFLVASILLTLSAYGGGPLSAFKLLVALLG